MKKWSLLLIFLVCYSCNSKKESAFHHLIQSGFIIVDEATGIPTATLIDTADLSGKALYLKAVKELREERDYLLMNEVEDEVKLDRLNTTLDFLVKNTPIVEKVSINLNL